MAEREQDSHHNILKQESEDIDARISEDPEVERSQLVHFEDETYTLEKDNTGISFDMFIRIIE